MKSQELEKLAGNIMMTDPIADMLTRIRNAASAHNVDLVMPMSKIKFSIAKILETKGFLSKVEKVGEGVNAQLRLTLSYQSGSPVVQSLVRVSKPGRRVYVKATEISTVLSGLGVAILSTPNGLMTGDEARKRKLGGELICEVY